MNIENFKNKHSYQYKCFKKKDITDEDISLWIELYSQNKEMIERLGIQYNKIDNIKSLIKETEEQIESLRVKQFVNKNFSSRYRGLLDKQSRDYIRDLIRLNIDEETLKNQFFSNIRAFKTTELINLRLKNFLNLIKEFERESILKRLASNNVRVIYDKDNIVVACIDSFIQARVIGSMSWCISRCMSHYDSYSNAKIGGKYFFVWDFNKTAICMESFMAYNAIPTIKDNKIKIDIATKFNKNNESIREKKNKEIDPIVKNNSIMEVIKKDYSERLDMLNEFSQQNKNFELFYKNRDLLEINMLDYNNLLGKMQEKYLQRSVFYKFKLGILIDKIIISKIEKRRINIGDIK